MTIDEILERHGLTDRDYTLIGYNQEWYKEGSAISKSGWIDGDFDYAFVIHGNEQLLREVLASGAIIAYYPEPGVYLVKRIKSKQEMAIPRHPQRPDWLHCDRCHNTFPKSEWDYLSDMCEKCFKDRSRWECKSCGENLELENDIKEGRQWYGFVEYCKRCISPPQTTTEEDTQRGTRVYDMAGNWIGNV